MQWAEALSESTTLATLAFLLTIYALFGDDTKIVNFTYNEDLIFDILTVLAFSVFLVELVAQVIAVQGYFGSFFFLLDFASTMTLIFDISAIMYLPPGPAVRLEIQRFSYEKSLTSK